MIAVTAICIRVELKGDLYFMTPEDDTATCNKAFGKKGGFRIDRQTKDIQQEESDVFKMENFITFKEKTNIDINVTVAVMTEVWSTKMHKATFRNLFG